MDARSERFRQQHRRELRRIGRLLQSLRKDAGLRQIDLAARLGRSQSYVTKYESGERRLDLFELDEVCRALGVALSDLVGRYRPGKQDGTGQG